MPEEVVGTFPLGASVRDGDRWVSEVPVISLPDRPDVLAAAGHVEKLGYFIALGPPFDRMPAATMPNCCSNGSTSRR